MELSCVLVHAPETDFNRNPMYCSANMSQILLEHDYYPNSGRLPVVVQGTQWNCEDFHNNDRWVNGDPKSSLLYKECPLLGHRYMENRNGGGPSI